MRLIANVCNLSYRYPPKTKLEFVIWSVCRSTSWVEFAQNFSVFKITFLRVLDFPRELLKVWLWYLAYILTFVLFPDNQITMNHNSAVTHLQNCLPWLLQRINYVKRSFFNTILWVQVTYILLMFTYWCSENTSYVKNVIPHVKAHNFAVLITELFPLTTLMM